MNALDVYDRQGKVTRMG